MATSSTKAEKDYIRSAFRVLNLQAIVAMLMVLVLPYVMSFQIISDLLDDISFISGGYARSILEDYQSNPGPEQAQALASANRAIIAQEGNGQRWYTNGEDIIFLQAGESRPYVPGLGRAFTLDDDVRLIIVWPSPFFGMRTHGAIFLSWVSMPFVFLLLLYLLIRKTLHPLRWMQKGIQELTAGNLDYSAPTTGRDRNNALAQKFNTMASSIRTLIKSKDQMIMDLSHELRSPITRIKVALELMPADKNLEVVAKNIANLEDIITTILEAQRINLQNIEHKREPCALAELLRENVELTRTRQAAFRFLRLDEALVLSGDRGLLKLLIHNLLDNALKYSAGARDSVELSLYREADKAVLEFSDKGPGIPEEMLSQVFEPFFKVAPERGFHNGYGLGLSLCRRIAELHGGTIELHNKPEGGLLAKVTLPLDN